MADYSVILFNSDFSALLKALPDSQLAELLNACTDETLRRIRNHEG